MYARVCVLPQSIGFTWDVFQSTKYAKAGVYRALLYNPSATMLFIEQRHCRYYILLPTFETLLHVRDLRSKREEELRSKKKNV